MDAAFVGGVLESAGGCVTQSTCGGVFEAGAVDHRHTIMRPISPCKKSVRKVSGWKHVASLAQVESDR